MGDKIKSLATSVVLQAVCLLMVANAEATVTNADWTFPASTSPGPSQPIAADIATYSINDFLGWTAAGSHLSEAFVANPGKTTALQFSYNGNQASSMNGSTLTLTTTTSGLGAGFSLAGIQLAYEVKWSNTGNIITNTWAFSLNGGGFLDFETNAVIGSSWLTSVSPISGLQLTNGDTLVLRDTFSGATGNGQNLQLDDILISSAGTVPEPSSLDVAVLAFSLAGLIGSLRRKQIRLD